MNAAVELKDIIYVRGGPDFPYHGVFFLDATALHRLFSTSPNLRSKFPLLSGRTLEVICYARCRIGSAMEAGEMNVPGEYSGEIWARAPIRLRVIRGRSSADLVLWIELILMSLKPQHQGTGAAIKKGYPGLPGNICLWYSGRARAGYLRYRYSD